MWLLLRFVLGLAFGSFFNVIAMRYDPDRFLFARPVWEGRSRCPHCGRTLRWYELLPLVSFIIQRRRCRTCDALLSYQYPLAEIVMGLIFLLVPMGLAPLPLRPELTVLAAVFWIAVFALLFLMALIDLRLQIIPDEIVILLAGLGLMLAILSAPDFGFASGSFVRDYALLFGLRTNIWLNHLAAAAFGALFFGLIIFLTRGRGMGMGDLKLAAALGVVFGWPDIIFLVIFGFLIGSVYGGVQLLRGKERMKSAVPFGPFLALGGAALFFFGNAILHGYFSLFGL